MVSSPKCSKCSLSAICLPDETNRCRAADGLGEAPTEVRLPATPRDDLRPLYLNTQGVYVGKSGEVLVIKDNGKVIQEVRLREINQVNLFGNIQVSTQALQTLNEMEIPLVLHSQHGYFNGMLQGLDSRTSCCDANSFAWPTKRENVCQLPRRSSREKFATIA